MRIKNHSDYRSQFSIVLCVLLIVVVSFSSLSITAMADPNVTDISIQTAHGMINNTTLYPNLTILDVRTQGEYDSAHLFDAMLIPLDQLNSRINELEPYKDSVLIVYCRSGSRSQQASQILVNNNFTKIFNMLGGINAWIDAGYDYWSSENSPSIAYGNIMFIFVIIGMLSVIILVIKARNLIRFKHL